MLSIVMLESRNRISTCNLHQPVKNSIKEEKKTGYMICFAIVKNKRASHLII